MATVNRKKQTCDDCGKNIDGRGLYCWIDDSDLCRDCRNDHHEKHARDAQNMNSIPGDIGDGALDY